MNFDRLESTYWLRQKERVEQIRQRIAARASVLDEGRVIPSDEDLSHGVGRRLYLAVLFIDLVGSSTRPAESLAEQQTVLRVYDLFFTEIIRIAEEYGGTVEKNTGDGLMVYFARTLDDDVDPGQRALSSVLSMKYVTKNLINPILAVDGIPPLQFRAGIDAGPVAVAQIGAARRFGNLVAIGATANLACKMLKDTGPVVLIGENVYNKLPPDWQPWCSVHPIESGYVFQSSGQKYRIFSATCEWTDPL